MLGWVIAILGIVAIWKANAATLLYVRFLGALAVLGSLTAPFFRAISEG